MSKSNLTIGFSGCFIIICILLCNLALGGFCSDYVLWSAFHTDIPWYVDMIVGLIGAEFMIPSAIICWILTFFMTTPFFS